MLQFQSSAFSSLNENMKNFPPVGAQGGVSWNPTLRKPLSQRNFTMNATHWKKPYSSKKNFKKWFTVSKWQPNYWLSFRIISISIAFNFHFISSTLFYQTTFKIQAANSVCTLSHILAGHPPARNFNLQNIFKGDKEDEVLFLTNLKTWKLSLDVDKDVTCKPGGDLHSILFQMSWK